MIDELRHFLLIVEHGTFTRAAEAAGLSQPALTASIRRLEQWSDARLLHRHPRGATPTAAGEALIPRARAAIAAVEEGRRAVAEVEGLQAGEVRVGGGATACTYLLPPVIAGFRAQHPRVTVRLREVFTPHVREAVESGQMDLGVGEGEPLGPQVDAWRPDPLVLVAAPPLAASLRERGDTLPPGTPFVSFHRGASLRQRLEESFPDGDVVMELGGIAAIKGLVRAGVGVALLSRASVEIDLEAGRLVEIPDRRAPRARQLVLLHPGLDRLPPAAAAMREMLLAAAK